MMARFWQIIKPLDALQMDGMDGVNSIVNALEWLLDFGQAIHLWQPPIIMHSGIT
jgi:hypothetical protein